jgi:DNA-binding beta-propeller fold protein YncE
MTRHFFLSILIITTIIGKHTFAQSGYKFSQSISLQGDGKWDYMQMDEAANRLFITHEDQVHVIDLLNNKETGVINNLFGAHHIALVPEFKKGFITNGGNNTVTVFDYQSLHKITTIKINGVNPDPMCYDSYSKKLYVFCDNNTAVVINPVSNKIIGTIALGGSPDFALPDGGGLIYNDLEGSDETVVISVKEKKIIKRFKLPKHSAPTGLAFDKINSRLFISCRGINKLAVLDVKTGKVITLLPMPSNVDGVSFDPETRYIICSGGDGHASIIKQEGADQYKTIDHLKTKPGAKTMELDPKTHNLYFSAASFKNGQTNRLHHTFELLIYKK